MATKTEADIIFNNRKLLLCPSCCAQLTEEINWEATEAMRTLEMKMIQNKIISPLPSLQVGEKNASRGNMEGKSFARNPPD